MIESAISNVAKLFGKLQGNDFDSPATIKGGFIFHFYKNLQLLGNWFANNFSGAMIILEDADTVIIWSNQGYPKTI